MTTSKTGRGRKEKISVNRRPKPLVTWILLLLCLVLPLTASACTNKMLGMDQERAGELPQETTLKIKVPFSVDAQGKHSSSSLVQALAFALNGEYPLEDIYESLGQEVLQDLTLDEFRLFIDCLSPSKDKRISDFTQLSGEESLNYLYAVLRLKGRLADRAINSVFYRLDFQSEGGPLTNEDNSFLVAVQVNGNGEAYLDAEWIREINKLYTYCLFYFDSIENAALSQGDYGPLAYIIEQGPAPLISAKEAWPEVARKRAEATANYYQERVITNPTSSRSVLVLPGYAVFAQEYRYQGRLSGIREIIFQESDGTYSVSENIPQSFDTEQSQLLIYNEPLFSSLGARAAIYESTDIHPLAGPLLSQEKLEDYKGDSGSGDYYLLHYYGLDLVIKGIADATSGFWQGSLQEVRLSSSIYSLGPSLSVRMPEPNFYDYLPFYAEQQRQISMTNLFEQAELSYEANDGRISQLIIKKLG
ncbi:MAG: hypothetical protein Q4E09_04320 [Eubacteriales bacterium]|nr:hypothetical protein [Eubacteriales bacterium]